MNVSPPLNFWGAPCGRWYLWLTYLLLWTAALLAPIPQHSFTAHEILHFTLKFILSKSLHIAAYAGLAMLSGWLGVQPRWRWLLMFVIMVHASLTELGQTALVARSGQLLDVVFDHVGIALGLLWSWKWWLAPEPAAQQTQDS